MIRADYKLQKINFENILLIEGLDDYVKIHLKSQTVITTKNSLKNISEKLPAHLFIRVHRSYIVPVASIKSFVSKSLQIENFVIPVGETYKADVLKFLK